MLKHLIVTMCAAICQRLNLICLGNSLILKCLHINTFFAVKLYPVSSYKTLLSFLSDGQLTTCL